MPSASGAPAFRPDERRLAARLKTPALVQRWLETLPYNWETRGETLRTFRGVLRSGTAHCLEAALSAAAVLETHGWPPLLLDLESKDGLDHVLFLHRGPRGWGTVARSRDPGLHGRKPVYPTVRALALSYEGPFVDHTGRLTGYGVLDLRTVSRVDWRLASTNVWAVERTLIEMPHRRLRTSERRYRAWLERFRAFKAKWPARRPAYYPDRARWL